MGKCCAALGMLVLVDECLSHGNMLRPIPRNNAAADKDLDKDPGCVGGLGSQDGACMHSFEGGCIIGCDCMPLESGCTRYFGQNVTKTCPCDTIMEPTNNEPRTRSWNINNESPFGDWTRYHPWRAPGHARLATPCPGDYSPNVVETWVAGSTAWAWWSVVANHGGGYQYRLCPKSRNLTNECFEEMPVVFATDNYTIRYSSTVGTTDVLGKPDVIAKATELSLGTKPIGSTWRRVPVPGCNCDSVAATCFYHDKDPCAEKGIEEHYKGCQSYCDGGHGGMRSWPSVYYGFNFSCACEDGDGCELLGACPPGPHNDHSDLISSGSPTTCHSSYEQQVMPMWYPAHTASGGLLCDSGFQFPPPAAGIYGKGAAASQGFKRSPVSYRFGDELRVPKTEGEYVLQWRWDCEESSQIWASCADINIVAEGLVV